MIALWLYVAGLSAMTGILDKCMKIRIARMWSDVDRAVDRYADNISIEIK